MPFRAGFRPVRAFAPFRASFRQTFSKRWESTVAGDAAAEAAKQAAKKEKEKLNPFAWNSPVGPKTVHFWAPVMKWILVGVTLSDFARPADQLSLTQNGALAATGAIWTRWCLIIKPKNYLLAAVNFFLFLANGVQVGRYLNYTQSLKQAPVSEQIKDAAKGVEGKAEELAADVKSTAKQVVSK